MASFLAQLQERRTSLTPLPPRPTPTPPGESKTANPPHRLQAPLAEMHGTYLTVTHPTRLTPPEQIMHCPMTARPGYADVDSSEYLDTPPVLRQKVQAVAALLRASHSPCLYTGAGISTASGIGDYASEASTPIITTAESHCCAELFNSYFTLSIRIGWQWCSWRKGLACCRPCSFCSWMPVRVWPKVQRLFHFCRWLQRSCCC